MINQPTEPAEPAMQQPSGEPVQPDPRPQLRAEESEKFPYPAWTYPARLLWSIVWLTVWKLAWNRIHCLRPLILRCFGAKVSLRSNIHGSAWVEMPWLLKMDQWISLGPRTHLYNLGGVTIGERTVISQDVYICAGTHDYTNPLYPLLRPPITIGKNVWIAAGAFIGPGVTIGDGAVIGARAVVTKDVAPWTVVAGNPAKFVKERVLKDPALPPSP
jgi:putative colanic acid biosynthesis acetyltransferase WcaF